MFVVTEAEATAIRAAFERGGEFSAAVELRRLFPGITDTAQARECARTIAGSRFPSRSARAGRCISASARSSQHCPSSPCSPARRLAQRRFGDD
jgi:hypothetical protein